jgi:acyl transferase domain-containing protein
MARGLYQASPVVRDVLDRCDARLHPVLGASLLEVMFGDDGRLDDTLFAQPALLAVELALLALWRSWGVRPAAVLGHSVGEYAAACAAGVLAEDDALVLIAERARAMSSLPRGGAMASVVVAEEKLVEALGGVEVAAWNAPGHVVLSGDAAALEAALAALPGSVVDRLRVSHAFHSRLMEPALPGFAAAAARVAYAPPSLPFFSTVTGARAAAELADAAYWRDQIRRPVRFADAARALAADGCPVWLELGPHPTLLGMARLGELDDHLGVPSLRRGRDDWQTLLTAAGVLHGAGVALDWDGFDAPYPRRRVWLPATPFDKRRHWVEPSRREAEDPDAHPLLGRLLRSPLAARQHQARLTPDRPAFLADHVVHGSVVVPGTAYVEMLVAAFGGPPLEIADLVIERPLRLPPEGRTVQTILEPRAGGGFDARIASLEGERWTTHVTAVLNDGATELAATGARALPARAVDGRLLRGGRGARPRPRAGLPQRRVPASRRRRGHGDRPPRRRGLHPAPGPARQLPPGGERGRRAAGRRALPAGGPGSASASRGRCRRR